MHHGKLRPGTRVGPYELVRMLGEGGMGSVHEARSPHGPNVALKVVSMPNVGNGPDPRFLREAEVLRSLSHSGIVPVLDYGIDASTKVPYLVMEMLEGDDLAGTIERTGRLASEVVVAIGIELLDALAHAHERKVVHRDIKPANVFLPRDRARGRAVLCDFGLSKRTDLVVSLTETGALLGTPHYMSPEQFLDAKRVDGRSDVFSLAMTLLHALAGANPFDHLVDHAELMIALCTKPVPDARTLLATAPADLATALAGALVTDPRRRSDLATFRAALAACDLSAASGPQRVRNTRPMTGAPSTKKASRSTVAAPSSAPLTLVGAGTYKVGSRVSGDGNIHDGLDGDGRVVRIERMVGVLRTAEGRAAFERETQALQSVLSESTVALLDHGELGDDAWLVTEPKGGQDLQSFVDESGPQPYARMVRAFTKASRGLSALAEVGLVHGHLRPEAFHFRPGQRGRRVLVLHDLGVARRLAPFSEKRSISQESVGKKDVDPRADVVGMVAALCFVVTGKLPFGSRGGKSSVKADVLAAGGLGVVEKRGLEALLKRAVEGKIASLAALSLELRTLVSGTATRA